MLKNTVAAFAALLAITGSALAFAGSPPPPPQSTVSQTNAGLAINDYGDSLTKAGQDGTTLSVPLAIQTTLGVTVNNYGIGGQTSTQAAMRAGITQTTLTFSSNTIVAGGSNTTITAIGGVALAGMNTAQDPDYRLLSTTADNTTRTISGWVCGTHGVIRRTASGGPPSTTETYIYTADAVYASTSCAAASVFTPDSAANLGQPFVYEGGRNNYTNASTVEADWGNAASAAAANGNSNYLLLNILAGDYASEQSGQSGATQIATLNSYLASHFPGHYFDWLSYLISQYNVGNPVDVQNHANGVVPYTLRAVVGSGTLTAAITTTGTCSISLSGTPATSQTLKVDSEYIYITGVSGNSITACTRGYGTGGVAATHSNGASYTLTDPLHLAGAAGYQPSGNNIANTYKSLLTPPTVSYVNPNSIGQLLTWKPMTLGNPWAPWTMNGTMILNGGSSPSGAGLSGMILNNGVWLHGYDQNGNVMQLLRPLNGAIVVGNSNIQNICLGTGGAGSSACAASVTNGGGLVLSAGSSSSNVATAGMVAQAKITDPGTAPGAGFAKSFWVTGTNAGTCKLVAYAGTSTTPVTIIDNVGAGC